MIDTKKLEAFATAARTQLITEVTARLNAVLAPGSTAQVEAPEAVKALNTAIRDHGGGTDGRKHVAEQQAYVWFNRIIAFRFMDTNGYTTTPIVSPESGRTTGQPAVLAAAKRGEYNPDIYGNAKTVQRITGLLNGTIPSADRDGEAYGLILGAHCAHWHQAMPFMFTNAGDYSGLLMPAGLLAETSVLSRAAITLTADDCQDVEVIGWLYQYYIAEKKAQVFDSFSRGGKAGPDEIPAATQLFTPDWIVRYLVQNSVGRLWLLNHPQSKLADQMEYYIAPEGDPGEFLKIGSPQELTVLDPACGSGHMLTYAFDLLYAIYEEEGYAPSQIPGLILTENLHGLEIDERAGALAAFALTMKARRRQRRFFATKIEPNVCVLRPISFTPQELDELVTQAGDRNAESDFWNVFAHADTFGSLIKVESKTLTIATKALAVYEPTIDGSGTKSRGQQVVAQAAYLSRTYAVIITNPPYMASKSMSAALVEHMKRNYRDGKADLFAAFMQRSFSLVSPGGHVGMITMQTWMFLSSFAKLRESVLRSLRIAAMLHLGARAFDSISGEVVSTTAFVVVRSSDVRAAGVYIRAVDGASEKQKRSQLVEAVRERTQDAGWYSASAADFEAIPASPIVYWLPTPMLSLFRNSASMDTALTPRVGLMTTDNEQFLRMFWEVSASSSCLTASNDDEAHESGRRWFPHNKGGANRRWSGNYEYVVDWQDRGRRIKQTAIEKYPYLNGNPNFVVHDDGFYFRPFISWSEIGSAAPAFRLFTSGFTSNVKGMSAFPHEHAPIPMSLLAFLNSSVIGELALALNPTMSFGANNFRSLPVGPVDDDVLSDAGERLVKIAQDDWDCFETSWAFTSLRLANFGDRVRAAVDSLFKQSLSLVADVEDLEALVNSRVAAIAGLTGQVNTTVKRSSITLGRNPEYAYGSGRSDEEYQTTFATDAVSEFVSYAVGCMFGRYSLNEPGLILASQGETLADYLKRVPAPSFTPDTDNVIPVTDGEWFEDDIVARFRQFLRVSFGSEHFAENLAFVEQTLGKSLRAYFVKDFYDDHVKRYKNRPIYWMFSSSGDAKGAFKALIYLHRYTPATLHTLLTNYLREFQAKLRAEIATLERSGGNAELKKATALRKALTECEDYERNTLYPLASRNPELDLDDGVLVNYLRFGKAVVKIAAIEKNRSKVEGWTWPHYPLRPEDGA